MEALTPASPDSLPPLGEQACSAASLPGRKPIGDLLQIAASHDQLIEAGLLQVQTHASASVVIVEHTGRTPALLEREVRSRVFSVRG